MKNIIKLKIFSVISTAFAVLSLIFYFSLSWDAKIASLPLTPSFVLLAIAYAFYGFTLMVAEFKED